jgi:hypothetical protein
MLRHSLSAAAGSASQKEKLSSDSSTSRSIFDLRSFLFRVWSKAFRNEFLRFAAFSLFPFYLFFYFGPLRSLIFTNSSQQLAMDSVDVFRQLGGGVRFNKKKYADDIDFFKVPYHLRDRSFSSIPPSSGFTTRSFKIRSPCAPSALLSLSELLPYPGPRFSLFYVIIFNIK